MRIKEGSGNLSRLSEAPPVYHMTVNGGFSTGWGRSLSCRRCRMHLAADRYLVGRTHLSPVQHRLLGNGLE